MVGGAQDAVRFQAEVRLLARLNHPHIIRVLDAGECAGRPWYTMRLADAGTLARPGAARVSHDLLRVGVHVADALAYLHAAGIVHRDIKPSNVLLDGEGYAYLADFGVAQLTGATRVTGTGLLVGTVAFLAPEQIRGEPVGPAADIYALGLSLLERLTGRREYAGPPAEAAMARLIRPPQIPSTLSPGWSDLLAAMTAMDPVARPTAAAIRDDLAHRTGASSSGQLRALAVQPVPHFSAQDLVARLDGGAEAHVADRSAGTHRPFPRILGVAAGALGGALSGGTLVALILTGGLIGPPRHASPQERPSADDQVRRQQTVAEPGSAPVPSTPAPAPVTRTPEPPAIRTPDAIPPWLHAPDRVDDPFHTDPPSAPAPTR